MRPVKIGIMLACVAAAMTPSVCFVRGLLRYCSGIKQQKKKKKDGVDPHLIPTDTKIDVALEPNQKSHCVDLVLKTSRSDTVIQLVTIFAEQLFPGESHVVVSSKLLCASK